MRFAAATILIGPAAFTLNGWAAGGFRESWHDVAWSHVVTSVHFISYVCVFFPAIAWARMRPPLPLLVRAGACFGLAVVATSLAVLFCHSSCMDLNGLKDTFLRTAVFGLVLSPVLLLIEHIWDSLGETRRVVERQALAQESERRSAAEARWTSLESRLHPHFVFNTLASIRELLHRDPRQADRMIQRFADLLRFSLDAPQHPLITLQEEMHMVSGYLQIEEMRLGRRLVWNVDATPSALAFKVPSLSVLTLAENAIKHAIAPRRSGGEVRVTASLEHGSLFLEVADDGPGFPPGPLPPGHGLHLLEERLRLLYGDAATFEIVARQPGVAVRLSLPTYSLEQASDAEAALLRS